MLWAARGFAATAADIGQWRTLPSLMPINPIHTGVLNTGKVLVVAGSENVAAKHAESSRAGVWDPATDTFTMAEVS